MLMPEIALFSWPLVVLILFRTLSPAAAVATAIIAGYLLLPGEPSINAPLLPTIDKDSMPAITAMAMALIFAGTAGHASRARSGPTATILPGWLPRTPVSHLLLAMLFIGSILTVLTNGDRLVYGDTTLPAIQLYSGFSAILTSLVMLLPFLLARKFLADDDGHRTLLRILCLAGLLYSVLVLYEIHMSPQLNRMVYGFFPHSWIQHIRGNGFRPLVFLHHGLWLAIFMAGTFLAALGMTRLSSGATRLRYLAAAGWLFATLALSNSFGALLIAICAGGLILAFPVRIVLLSTAVIAAIMLTYPVLRGADLVPVDRIASWVGTISDERRRSFVYRTANEDILLEKANERPLAGWGGWSRGRVFDEDGRDISTTDGLWVIVIGRSGWIGYLAQFGLLGLPLILLAFRQRARGVGAPTAFLGLILAANMVDLIPNATRTPVTWLIAGALMGRLELSSSRAAARSGDAAPTADPPIADAAPTAAGPEPRLSPQYSARYTRQKYLHERTDS